MESIEKQRKRFNREVKRFDEEHRRKQDWRRDADRWNKECDKREASEDRRARYIAGSLCVALVAGPTIFVLIKRMLLGH